MYALWTRISKLEPGAGSINLPTLNKVLISLVDKVTDETAVDKIPFVTNDITDN